ncbi:MAG: hypothetical protein QM765_30175 [Myxococcales bacterium]
MRKKQRNRAERHAAKVPLGAAGDDSAAVDRAAARAAKKRKTSWKKIPDERLESVVQSKLARRKRLASQRAKAPAQGTGHPSRSSKKPPRNNLPLLFDEERFSDEEIAAARDRLRAMDRRDLSHLDSAIATRWARRPAKVAMICAHLGRGEGGYEPILVCERIRQLGVRGALAVAGNPLRPRFSEVLSLKRSRELAGVCLAGVGQASAAATDRRGVRDVLSSATAAAVRDLPEGLHAAPATW